MHRSRPESSDHWNLSSQWGVPVTSLARTVVDVARISSLVDGVAAGDRALFANAISLGELRHHVELSSGLRGASRARSMLDLVDGRRETAIESLSWVRFLDWDIPLPQMQCELRDDDGFAGRVDFLWVAARVIGEADGRLKYRSRQDLWDEKRREMRLQRMGFTVVRWSWSDVIDRQSPFRRVLQAALRAA